MDISSYHSINQQRLSTTIENQFSPYFLEIKRTTNQSRNDVRATAFGKTFISIVLQYWKVETGKSCACATDYGMIKKRSDMY